MIRALTLTMLLAQSITLCSAIETEAGYPTPSEIAAESVEDFTDSGVGCLDDCLEPFTDPATVPDEYELERKNHENNS